MIKAGLDIGNSKISCVVADYKNTENINILSIASVPNNNIKKNIILNFENLHDQINGSINENSWVKEIYLNTNYKDTLFIRIEEYKPIGIYFFNEKYFVFDKNGKIIDQIYIKDFTNQSLLIFKGNSSNLKANSLINILKNNDFEKKYQIESLEFINKRRWDINLYSDVKLMLSEEDPNKSIQNFITIQNKLSETETNNIKTYDLRNAKKTILINLND